jgi:hypothetical protein
VLAFLLAAPLLLLPLPWRTAAGTLLPRPPHLQRTPLLLLLAGPQLCGLMLLEPLLLLLQVLGPGWPGLLLWVRVLLKKKKKRGYMVCTSDACCCHCLLLLRPAAHQHIVPCCCV